jgi:hypothetical protein
MQESVGELELRPINTMELPLYIGIAYKGDKELLETYCSINGSLEFVTNEIYKVIIMQSRYGEMDIFGVFWEGKIIGYTICVKPNHLFSFAINIKYRIKEILNAWWTWIVTWFDSEFGTFLYKKNTRAIDFCKRNGMITIDENETYETLIYVGCQS